MRRLIGLSRKRSRKGSKKMSRRSRTKKCKDCKKCKLTSRNKCACDKKSCKCYKLRLKRMFGNPMPNTIIPGF